ncbi:MAG: magnesium/cobalt transporter CorA [Prochlorotrichaceae cyanobacterium]|jgi:magnesium transporter
MPLPPEFEALPLNSSPEEENKPVTLPTFWEEVIVKQSEPEEDYDESYYDYHYDEPGSIPGTLVIDRDSPVPVVTLIEYGEKTAERLELQFVEDCLPFLPLDTVTWVDVHGLGSESVLKAIGQVFQLHPLLLEDIVNVPQRPKIEEYDDQLLMITRMIMPNEEGEGFITEQVSFVLSQHFLLTVQEEPFYDTFNPVRDRIRLNKGIIRRQGVDYLAYALLDTIIDGFFPILEDYGERLEDLEDEVVLNPTRKTLEKIYKIRREILTLRRAIWPQRDAINFLIREKSALISEPVWFYLRDCYDHAVQVMDMVETYRELSSSLMDVYLSSINNRMSDVMKTLTVVSTIFIPLTFIAGIYGMNFNTTISPVNMPELNAYWGYPLCLALMTSIGSVLLYIFWQKGWLESTMVLPQEWDKHSSDRSLTIPKPRRKMNLKHFFSPSKILNRRHKP